MTSQFFHGVRLSPILCHSGVDDAASSQNMLRITNHRVGWVGSVPDDVWANWGLEDIGKRVGLFAGLAIRPNNGDDGTCRHLGGEF